METECTVRQVVIRGTAHTHESVVRNEFRALRHARTLGEVQTACLGALGELRELNIFESADVFCERAPDDSVDGRCLTDVVVTVKEKKRLSQASTVSLAATVRPNTLRQLFCLQHKIGIAW